jgi:soluble lytic murein transglycosylase-like protein
MEILPFEWLTFRNPFGFISKVREVSAKLQIKPEWLMLLIWVESRFDSQAINPVAMPLGSFNVYHQHLQD